MLESKGVFSVTVDSVPHLLLASAHTGCCLQHISSDSMEFSKQERLSIFALMAVCHCILAENAIAELNMKYEI